VATAGEIQSGRRNEGIEVQKNLAKTGSMSFIYRTLTDAAGHAINVQIGTETGDGGGSLKVKSIDKALRTLIESGFALVDLTFYCTDAAGVPCVAYMGDTAGNAAYTVFMGPKTGLHNPQATKSAGITGGIGQSGMRGVADQVYDGTQRWFGNPKMHAHATTVVIHEIGHVLHDAQSAALFWDYKLGRPGAGGWLAFAPSVSHYATQNPLEFVAETFAGRLCGKTYAGVAAPYAAVGGPRPVAGNFP
jgi:hypothetical protein